jgi:hypothetical protein
MQKDFQAGALIAPSQKWDALCGYGGRLCGLLLALRRPHADQRSQRAGDIGFRRTDRVWSLGGGYSEVPRAA